MEYLRYKEKSGLVYDLLRFGLLCCVCLAFATPIFAQTSGSSGFITADDVYQNPDDHDLNLRYAKQEIRRGELINAGSALERMLYANPNWHSSRLLYAAVLYRLDDRKAALRELSLLKGRELNDYQQETYQRYLEEFQTPIVIQPASASTSLSKQNTPYQADDPIKADVSLSFRADDNAGNALTDEGFGFDNRGDISVTAQGRILATNAISDDGTIKARAAIGGQFRRHETFSQADYDVIDLQLGVSASPEGKDRMSLDLDIRRVNVSGEKYLLQVGPRLTLSQPLSDKTRATVSLAAYDQNYDVLPTASREDDRDGTKARLQLGLQTTLSPAQKLSVAVGYDKKTAQIDAFAYNGFQALVGYEYELKNESYLKTQVSARRLNYAGSLVSSVRKRDDARIFMRQAFGMALSKIIANPSLEEVGVEFGINYNERLSNVDANDYDNLGADMRLKFNF